MGRPCIIADLVTAKIEKVEGVNLSVQRKCEVARLLKQRAAENLDAVSQLPQSWRKFISIN